MLPRLLLAPPAPPAYVPLSFNEAAVPGGPADPGKVIITCADAPVPIVPRLIGMAVLAGVVADAVTIAAELICTPVAGDPPVSTSVSVMMILFVAESRLSTGLVTICAGQGALGEMSDGDGDRPG